MKRVSPIAFASLLLVSAAVFPRISDAQELKLTEPAASEAIAQKAIASAEPNRDKNGDKNGDSSPEGQKLYDSGVRLYESGKFVEALRAFKEATKVEPNDPQTYFMLGMAQTKVKVYKDAVDSFKRATRLKPDWPEAYFQLGVLSYVLGRRAQVAEAHTTLLRLNSPLAGVLNRAISGDKNRAGVANNNNVAEPPVPPPVQTVVPAAENAEANSSVVRTSTVTVPETAPAKGTNNADAPRTVNAATGANNADAPRTVNAATGVTDPALAGIYRIGVGDVLDIRLLYSRTPRSTLFTVIEGGLIDYAIAGGPIVVAGLTTDEIQTFIIAELKRRAVADGVRVSVGVRQYASHSVSIIGLVNNPGAKFLRREAVPLYVIMAESQARQDAGRVTIMREGTEVLLDLSENSARNFLILPGDLINVTARPQQFYYIGGRVNYPGQKPFAAGITLLQALLAAGGPARQGDNVIDLSREDQAGRLSTSRIKLKEIKAGKIPDPRLQPGDRIDVVR